MAEYIEREKAWRKVNRAKNIEEALNIIDGLPTADVVPVVRCKDCIYCVDLGMSGLYCDHDDNRNPCGCRPDDYCNDGERIDKR